MRGKFYTQKDKEKVKQLLLTGKSYSEIMKLLGVPKSTISTWFGKILRRPINKWVRREHFARIHKLASIALKKKYKRKREEEAQLVKINVEKDLKHYPLENTGFYKAMLAMLYWAEGDKGEKGSGIKFTNTDPLLAKLYVRLLRMCYDIDETKFSIRLYVHYYHSIKKVKNFWSKTLNISLSQFFSKIYVKKRSRTKRFRKNFAGICFIYYGNTLIRKELLELGHSLEKLITKSAPVAQRIEHLAADQKVVGSIPARRTTNTSMLYRRNFI